MKAVDNESLSGDTKKRHSKAIEEASQFKNKDGSIETLGFKLFMQEYIWFNLKYYNEKVTIYFTIIYN